MVGPVSVASAASGRAHLAQTALCPAGGRRRTATPAPASAGFEHATHPATLPARRSSRMVRPQAAPRARRCGTGRSRPSDRSSARPPAARVPAGDAFDADRVQRRQSGFAVTLRPATHPRIPALRPPHRAPAQNSSVVGDESPACSSRLGKGRLPPDQASAPILATARTTDKPSACRPVQPGEVLPGQGGADDDEKDDGERPSGLPVVACSVGFGVCRGR